MNTCSYFRKLQELLSSKELGSFFLKSYGIELLLFLFEAQKNEKEFSVDEIYSLLISPKPRRESFGIFLNQLEASNLIEKGIHTNKKSMKKIELTLPFLNASNSMGRTRR